MAALTCGLVLMLPLIHGKYGLGVAQVFLALFAAPLLLYLAVCRSTGGAIAIGLMYALAAGLCAAYFAWEIAQPIEGGPAPIGQGLDVFIIGGGQSVALWLGMAAALVVERLRCRFRPLSATRTGAAKPAQSMSSVTVSQNATTIDRQLPPASLEAVNRVSRGITVPLGIGLGGLVAALAGVAFAAVLWLTPLRFLFDFAHELAVVQVAALPILAFVGGAISGAISGCSRRIRKVFPLVAGVSPAALAFWFTDAFNQLFGFFLGMVGAVAISLAINTIVFRAIDLLQIRKDRTSAAIR